MSKKKILIAEDSHLKEAILAFPQASQYEMTFVHNGIDCLKLVHQLKPDLLIIDLLLPKMHAIEILKTIKREDLPPMGIIVMAYEIMMQNYQAAVDWGADYFLNKPFAISELYVLMGRFFDNHLKPDKFKGLPSNAFTSSIEAEIDLKDRPYLKFWGTRGSVSVSGASHIRYGGNTSCLEICSKGQSVIIDAGTGIVPLSQQLTYENRHEMHVFISHTHLDHIMGFPFFDPLYMKGMKVHIWAPVSFEKETKELFTDMLAYAFFPVRLEEMKGDIIFEELRDGSSVKVHDIKISCCYTYHPGPTLGFLIEVGGKKIGYITDNELFVGNTTKKKISSSDPEMIPHQRLLEFLKGCDILIHEAQYFDEEYKGKVGWGHSSLYNASQFVSMLKVPQWYVTHHDPKYSDDLLHMKFELHKKILRELGCSCQLMHAKDGLIIPL